MNTKRISTLAAFVAIVAVAQAAWASGGGHAPAGPDWGRLGASFVNFAIFIGAIVYFFGGKIRAAFAARRTTLLSTIEASKVRLATAQAAVSAAETKLASLPAERERLMADARRIGERDRDRSIEAGRAAAGKVIADSALQADASARRVMRELERKMVERALELAREDLRTRLTPEAQAKLVTSGIAKINAHPEQARA